MKPHHQASLKQCLVPHDATPSCKSQCLVPHDATPSGKSQIMFSPS